MLAYAVRISLSVVTQIYNETKMKISSVAFLFLMVIRV